MPWAGKRAAAEAGTFYFSQHRNTEGSRLQKKYAPQVYGGSVDTSQTSSVQDPRGTNMNHSGRYATSFPAYMWPCIVPDAVTLEFVEQESKTPSLSLV